MSYLPESIYDLIDSKGPEKRLEMIAETGVKMIEAV